MSDSDDALAELPRVTVVVPTFNGAPYLAETLTSIAGQTLGGVDVIVVDDGSTDDSARIAERHPVGATVLMQEHLGVAVARNRGLAAARSRWVAFLDQDDLWHPTHLERVVGWLEANSEERIAFVREVAFSLFDEVETLTEMDPLVGGWATIRVARDDTLGSLVRRTDSTGGDGVEYHDLAAMLAGPVSVTTSFVADAELLRLAGGFAPHALAMDDYWLLVNVARLSKIAHLDLPTVFYRVHASATSRSTRLGLPFLSSAVALRLGGGLVDNDTGIGRGTTGNLHEHLLRELVTSQRFRDRRYRAIVGALAILLWPPAGRRWERVRATIAIRLPLLRRWSRAARSAVRRVSRE
ncbi:glycosyltransferase family 2 protein [Microbacterium marinum]|uniref:glycosyltransferase family 2 protein n=1 Tax=Microbacterium marinum TaxID=421115 RepID=UPI00384AFA48